MATFRILFKINLVPRFQNTQNCIAHVEYFCKHISMKNDVGYRSSALFRSMYNCSVVKTHEIAIKFDKYTKQGHIKVPLTWFPFWTLPFFNLISFSQSLSSLFLSPSLLPSSFPLHFFPLPFPFHSSLFPSHFFLPHLLFFPNSLILFPPRGGGVRQLYKPLKPSDFVSNKKNLLFCQSTTAGKGRGLKTQDWTNWTLNTLDKLPTLLCTKYLQNKFLINQGHIRVISSVSQEYSSTHSTF